MRARVLNSALISAAVFCLASAVRAQQTAAPLVPIVSGLASSDTQVTISNPSIYSAFVPLRLSLTAGLFPMARAFPECESLEEASGNSVNGFAVQRYTFLRLTPRLVLHGFSSAGCPVDSGAG